jgi:hypothetical protein
MQRIERRGHEAAQIASVELSRTREDHGLRDSRRQRCFLQSTSFAERIPPACHSTVQLVSARERVQFCPGLLHCLRVRCFRMKNITLSADENLIEQARLIAKAQRKTLNRAFREWLEQFTRQSGGSQEFDSLMKRLKHVRAGRRFTRDEMNER